LTLRFLAAPADTRQSGTILTEPLAELYRL
jgi:hypothetical protein